MRRDVRPAVGQVVAWWNPYTEEWIPVVVDLLMSQQFTGKDEHGHTRFAMYRDLGSTWRI